MNVDVLLLAFRESETEVWYYSTKAHLDELISTLDGEEWERDLVYNLIEIKDDITKQMRITEELTNNSKGNKKSTLEIESGEYVKDMVTVPFQE